MAEDVSSVHPHTTLRTTMKAQRAALSAAQRVYCAQAVARHLFDSQALGAASRIAGYWAIAGELPLNAVAARISAPASYLLPRLAPEGQLRFAPWAPTVELLPNRYGIPEPDIALADCLGPDQLDVVLVPLLAFDLQGNRLGMGGGWYDRSFAFRLHGQPMPLLIGIGYAFQQVDALAAQTWDVPLDAVVTERGYLRLR
ncbi:MAG: 5-formyltetrahydrofolate cyclo-ligase [Xanthomonadaceae bacterium]|nr:5-formyltetrahydrofolate cyclo-ligase [Xanthomonadaceae bacterium]